MLVLNWTRFGNLECKPEWINPCKKKKYKLFVILRTCEMWWKILQTSQDTSHSNCKQKFKEKEKNLGVEWWCVCGEFTPLYIWLFFLILFKKKKKNYVLKCSFSWHLLNWFHLFTPPSPQKTSLFLFLSAWVL